MRKRLSGFVSACAPTQGRRVIRTRRRPRRAGLAV